MATKKKQTRNEPPSLGTITYYQDSPTTGEIIITGWVAFLVLLPIALTAIVASWKLLFWVIHG